MTADILNFNDSKLGHGGFEDPVVSDKEYTVLALLEAAAEPLSGRDLVEKAKSVLSLGNVYLVTSELEEKGLIVWHKPTPSLPASQRRVVHTWSINAMGRQAHVKASKEREGKMPEGSILTWFVNYLTF